MVEIYKEQMIDLLTLKSILTGDHLKDGYNTKTTSKKITLKEKPEMDGTITTYIDGLTCAKINS